MARSLPMWALVSGTASSVVVLLLLVLATRTFAEEERRTEPVLQPPGMMPSGAKTITFRGGLPAGSLICAIRVDHRTAVERLTAALRKHPGIESTSINPDSSLKEIASSMLPQSMDKYVRQLVESSHLRTIALMKKNGFGVDHFRETRIVSKTIRAQQSPVSTTVTAHIVDSDVTLGAPGTVALAYRTVREKRWGLANSHDLFSFGYHEFVTRVADAEVEALLLGVDHKTSSCRALGQNFPHEYLEEWKGLRADALKQ